MKYIFPFRIFSVFLLILMQNFSLCAQDQYTDSLRHAMQTASRESDRLHATVLLARDLLPAEMDSARALLEGTAALEQSEELLHRAYYHSAWGLYYWEKRDRQPSIDHYRKVLQLQPDPSILSLQAEAANHTGLVYYQLGVSDSARVYLHKALDIDKERDNKEGMAKTMYDLSRLHRGENQYELAFTYITEAIKLLEEHGSPRLLPFLYNVLGITHSALGNREQAATAYEQSLKYILEEGDEEGVASFYNNMAALWCEEEGALDTTLYYAHKGLELARAGGYTYFIAALLANKGQALFTAGEPAEALGYFKESMEYIHQIGNPRMEVDVSHRIGRAHKALGNFGEARQAQQRTLEIAKELQSPSFQSDALLALAAMDSLENRHEDFRRHYVRGIRLRDSIWSQENRSRIAELQIIHETEQKELEIGQLRHQDKVRQLRMTIVGAGSGLVFILLLLFIFYLRKRQKLARQQYQMKQQQVETRLEANRRELTGKALTLARSEKLIHQLKKDIRELMNAPDGDISKSLQSVLHLLKSEDNGKLLWKEFETRFNELNEGFISRLTERYPSLSPAEIRLCALLRLQMSTKEIAEMLNRSPRTIEYTRNSVRKKMDLQTGDNLVHYLLKI